MRAFDLWSRLRGPGPPPSYGLTRFVLLRLLGGVYGVAFLSLAHQLEPLIGEGGLLPVARYLTLLAAHFGPAAPLEVPTIFWLDHSDTFMRVLSYTGVGLSLIVLAGGANAPLLFLLWALYTSFNNVGQIFYGYGWEILLLETGFLAIFLCPPWKAGPFPRGSPPPLAVIWLYRWLAFRVMLGAGLIKLRGDPCWLDLSCLSFHYETQPLPNPLSWYLHQLPDSFHRMGVIATHLAECVAAWMVFGPRRVRHTAGVVLIGFQLLLILSGNLSFLNWLTIAVCIPCFDDSFFVRLLPRRLRSRLRAARDDRSGPHTPGRARRLAVGSLVATVLYLSVGPVRNMISPSQAMNRSFDRLDVVRTYGAFGSVGRQRNEIILQGTTDTTIDASTEWLEYGFKCKPGDVRRRPCIVSPYHYRIDWQIWFAAMSTAERQPWLMHLIYKLLIGDRGASSLLDVDPFGKSGEGPPRFIRAELYEYRFTKRGDPSEAWWTRRRRAAYLPPVSRDSRGLLRYLESRDLLSPRALE